MSRATWSNEDRVRPGCSRCNGHALEDGAAIVGPAAEADGLRTSRGGTEFPDGRARISLRYRAKCEAGRIWEIHRHPILASGRDPEQA